MLHIRIYTWPPICIISTLKTGKTLNELQLVPQILCAFFCWRYIFVQSFYPRKTIAQRNHCKPNVTVMFMMSVIQCVEKKQENRSCCSYTSQRALYIKRHSVFSLRVIRFLLWNFNGIKQSYCKSHLPLKTPKIQQA